jgi:hypothetical protein
MLDDYGAINGEQINFFDINGGKFQVEFEAVGGFTFDTATLLSIRVALAGVGDIAFVPQADIVHVAFNRWRERARVVVPREDRGMHVLRENRRIVVPPEREVLVRQKPGLIVA